MRLPIPSFRAGPLAVLPTLAARVPGAALVRRHRSSIAVLLIAGLGTGMVQLDDAPVAALPIAQAAAVEDPAADDATNVEETDTARRFLVVLRQPAPPTTTTELPTTTTTTPVVSEESTHAARPSPTTSEPAPAPFPITVLPTDDTQQAVIARLDGSRLIVAVPTNYFTLVTDAAVVGPLTPGGTAPGRQLMHDRDGRYWEAELDAVPAIVYELAGQIAASPTTTSPTHDEPTPATTTPAHGATTSATTHDEHTTTTAAAHDEQETTTAPAHGAATSAAAHDQHSTTTASAHGVPTSTSTTTHGHGTTSATMHGDAHVDDAATTGTMTTIELPASPLPANVLGPVAPHDLEAVLALAALPGVRTVRPLGGGVVEVIGDIDADALAAVAGVERVVERAS